VYNKTLLYARKYDAKQPSHRLHATTMNWDPYQATPLTDPTVPQNALQQSESHDTSGTGSRPIRLQTARGDHFI